MEPNTTPRTVVEKEIRLFLGLVRINYLVEDRRPDLTAEEYPRKYKHQIDVVVLWKKYSWVLRSYHHYMDQPFQD